MTAPSPPPEGFERRLRLDLKPRHLQLLVALDEYRSLAKVAGAIHITQPAVSKSLAEIERMLDVPLFERGPRGLTPTTQLVPRAVLRMKQLTAGSTVILREGTLGEMLAELRGERVDLIVGALPRDIREPGLQSLVLLEADPIVCAAGRHHPLAGQPRLEWSALAPYPWIVPTESASVRLPLQDWLEQQGLPLPVDRVESVSLTANLTLLQESLCIAFLSRNNAKHHAAQGLIAMLPLELRELSGPVGALWLRNKPMGPAMRALLDALQEVAGPAPA